jgi:uncharacterized membrane protein
MDKMLVVAFDTEEDAYKGLDALKELHRGDELTLYATAVLTKHPTGEVEVRQAADKGPVGTAVGALTGAIVGFLAGPVGSAVGAAAGAGAGGLAGLAFDVGSAGVNIDFLDEVSALLAPGRTVVIAEIDEDWVTPVDMAMAALGGQVFRRSRYDVVEDQLAQESAALSQEAKEMKQELKQEGAEAQAATKQTLQSVQQRLESITSKVDSRLDKVNKETDAKVDTLQARMQKARDDRKARIRQRIDEIKAKQEIRIKKLRAAREQAQEALVLS